MGMTKTCVLEELVELVQETRGPAQIGILLHFGRFIPFIFRPSLSWTSPILTEQGLTSLRARTTTMFSHMITRREVYITHQIYSVNQKISQSTFVT